jgi:1,2-diacylglycerol 3-beta-galactosyltransferase
MLHRKKVLILTADAGFGHRSAANSIASAIQEQYGGTLECEIINPVNDPRTPEIIRKPQEKYDWTVQTFPLTYNFYYQLSDIYPLSGMVTNVVAQAMVEVFREMLLKHNPDVVVSTYPLYNTALDKARRSIKMNVPVFVVITDLADVHKAWFQPGADKYFVPTDAVGHEALLSHVPARKIIVSGLPVNPRIAQEKRDKPTLRKRLGWYPKLPVVLAVGSKRVKGLYNRLEIVDQCPFPLQLAIVSGGNDELFNSARNKDWNKPAYIYNYVDDLPEMMRAADILITKAGGLITSEALACGLPLLYEESLPGQETGNVNYVCEHSAGVMAKSSAEVQDTLCRWLTDDQKLLKQFAGNARSLGKPDAAYQVAWEVWKAAAEKPGDNLEKAPVDRNAIRPFAWNS